MMLRHCSLLLLSSLLVVPSVSFGGHIDLFEAAHSAETTVAAPPTQGVGSSNNGATMALGGARDLFVNKTAGGEDERFRARVNPSGSTKLRVDSDTEVKGSVYVTYDGPDSNPNPFSGIDYNGLGGVDLTAAGMWDGFDLMVTFSDIGGPVNLSIFDNAANNAASVAKATFNVPAGIPTNTATSIKLPFSSFTGTTSAISNAGAVLLEVQNESGAWDLNILSLARTAAPPVPEPSSLALAAIGLLAGISSLRKRR